jgi:hypothetical protein
VQIIATGIGSLTAWKFIPEFIPEFFGTVTAGSKCCRVNLRSQYRVWHPTGILIGNHSFEVNQFSRDPMVKLICFEGDCEIDLIWAIQNIDIKIQKEGFMECRQLNKLASS